MDSLSIVHWVVVLVVLALYLVPAAAISRKAGYSGWWCLILLVPVVNVVMIYVFAFSTWPVLRNRVDDRAYPARI